MKILDKYILKQFLSTFVFVVLVLVSVIVIINISERNDDFIKHDMKLPLILIYYRDYIPFVANLITPLTVFIATVFVTSRLAARTEIVAMLGSGISFIRLLAPYFIGASIIAGLSFYLNAWVIPNSNKSRVAYEVKYFKRPFTFNDRDIHIKVAPESYIYMESYNNRANIGYKFTIETVREVNGKPELIEKISSKKIEWQKETQNWKIKDWMKRSFDGEDETITNGEAIDTVLSIRPKDFESNHMLYETFNLDELSEYVQEMKARGAAGIEPYMVERYTKFMAPFAVLILTFMGVIVSARKSRGGSGVQIAMGFLIAFIYIILFMMSKAVAVAGTMKWFESDHANMILALWLPNVGFTLLSLLMYKTVPR